MSSLRATVVSNALGHCSDYFISAVVVSTYDHYTSTSCDMFCVLYFGQLSLPVTFFDSVTSTCDYSMSPFFDLFVSSLGPTLCLSLLDNILLFFFSLKETRCPSSKSCLWWCRPVLYLVLKYCQVWQADFTNFLFSPFTNTLYGSCTSLFPCCLLSYTNYPIDDESPLHMLVYSPTTGIVFVYIHRTMSQGVLSYCGGDYVAAIDDCANWVATLVYTCYQNLVVLRGPSASCRQQIYGLWNWAIVVCYNLQAWLLLLWPMP